MVLFNQLSIYLTSQTGYTGPLSQILHGTTLGSQLACKQQQREYINILTYTRLTLTYTQLTQICCIQLQISTELLPGLSSNLLHLRSKSATVDLFCPSIEICFVDSKNSQNLFKSSSYQLNWSFLSFLEWCINRITDSVTSRKTICIYLLMMSSSSIKVCFFLTLLHYLNSLSSFRWVFLTFRLHCFYSFDGFQSLKLYDFISQQ